MRGVESKGKARTRACHGHMRKRQAGRHLHRIRKSNRSSLVEFSDFGFQVNERELVMVVNLSVNEQSRMLLIFPRHIILKGLFVNDKTFRWL